MDRTIHGYNDNLIRTKIFYCKTYKKYIYTMYATYNIKIYKLYDIYI